MDFIIKVLQLYSYSKKRTYYLIRASLITMAAIVSVMTPFVLHEAALYYLVSSIFQGLAAILGLLIVSYIFIKNDLWDHRMKAVEDAKTKKQYRFADNNQLMMAVFSMESQLPVRFWRLVLQMVFPMFLSLGILSIAPVLFEGPRTLGMISVGTLIGATCLALVDFVLFLHWGIDRKFVNKAFGVPD